jgi:hypothetical protein
VESYAANGPAASFATVASSRHTHACPGILQSMGRSGR